MSYDPEVTKNLLKLTVYYEQHPQGDVVRQLAAQLKEAETEIISSGKRALEAAMKSDRLEKELRETNLRLVTLASKAEENDGI